MEGSLSEAGTSPPHDLDTPHVPVARQTTTTTTTKTIQRLLQYLLIATSTYRKYLL